MASLPASLKEIRKTKGLTQARLAEILEISPRVYNRWEKGTATPYLDTVIQIADIFNVELDELVGRKEPKKDFVIHNHRLFELVQQIDHLPDEDQKALIILLDSLIKKNKLEQLVSG